MVSIKDFGAIGDGVTIDTRAIQSAIDSCAQAGGGTVHIPVGKFVTGAIFLRDRITLDLESGAVLLGSEHPEDYPAIRARWEGKDQETHAPLISGSGLRDIAVVGRGTIDGRGAIWWKMRHENRLTLPRPRLISFWDCSNVLIEGISALNSPSWNINPIRCQNVTINKLTIVSPADSSNTDGINPDSCRNVHISNCHIDVGDDCIGIKAGVETELPDKRAACENITVTNCTMSHGHGGVVIGSETSGDVRNIAISNCVFIGTDRGIRMKSRRGRGGIVEDIRVSNIIMREVCCPFTMNLYYHIGVKGNKDVADRRPRPVDSGTPRFQHIHFSHITAREAHHAAAFLYGLPEMPIEDVSFSSVSISMAANAQPGNPEMADGIEPMVRAGFIAQNVRGLRLENVQVSANLGEPFRLTDVTLAGERV